MTTPPDFRALLARARQKFLDYDMAAEESAPYEHRMLMDEIDAALEAVPAADIEPDEAADRIYGLAMKFLHSCNLSYSFSDYRKDVRAIFSRL